MGDNVLALQNNKSSSIRTDLHIDDAICADFFSSQQCFDFSRTSLQRKLGETFFPVIDSPFLFFDQSQGYSLSHRPDIFTIFFIDISHPMLDDISFGLIALKVDAMKLISFKGVKDIN